MPSVRIISKVSDDDPESNSCLSRKERNLRLSSGSGLPVSASTPAWNWKLCEPGVFDVRVPAMKVIVNHGRRIAQLSVVVARQPYYVYDEEIDIVIGNRALPIITEWAEDKDIVEQVEREQEALVCPGCRPGEGRRARS